MNGEKAVDLPMLHGMGDIGGLDQVLNNNCSLSIHGITRILFGYIVREGIVPASIAQNLQLLVRNICGQDSLEYAKKEGKPNKTSFEMTDDDKTLSRCELTWTTNCRKRSNSGAFE